MKYSHIFCIAMLALTAGCSTTTDLSGRMADWQGQDVAQALQTWGEPESQQAFGEQTVLIWRDRAGALLPGDAEAHANFSTVICERMLAVTDSGEITGWRWRGNACLALHTEPLPSARLMGAVHP